MRIARLQVSDFVGLEEYVLDAGKFNLITGHNGAGKTSILRAIKAALGGGDHAELIRNGKDQAEIVLVFDSGDKLRTIFAHGQRPRRIGESATGAPIPKIQTWLNERLEMMSFNPVAFMLADQDERLKWLLKVAPLRLAREELLQAAKPYPAEPLLSPDLLTADGLFKFPLDALAALRQRIYDERTGSNRIVNDRKTTIETLSLTLSSNEPAEDPTSRLKEKREELETIHGQRLIVARGVDLAESDSLASAKTTAQGRIDKVKAEAQRRIDAINEELRVEADRIVRLAKTAREEKKLELDVIENPLREEIGRLEEVVMRASKDAHTRRQIASFESDFTVQEKLSADLTAALARLDLLRTQLLEQLPLKGLEVRDGKLFYKDVDYESLNEANQVMVACRLAEVAAKDLGMICVEGIHKMLDSKRRAAFMNWAMKSNLQFFVTEVTEGPLSVETEATLGRI